MDSLTSREREVAALIARGLTNRQIAAELVITEATVAVHVKHVLSKTGFPSRARVAAWAAQQELLQGLAPLAPGSVPPLRPTWSDSPAPRGTRPRLVVAGRAVAPPRELTDDEWALIEPLLPPRAPTGRGRADDRQTLNGILWVLGTAARWADVPRRYGAASTCHVRFQQWQQQGIWDRMWRVLQRTQTEHRHPTLRALPGRGVPAEHGPDAAPRVSPARAGRRQAMSWQR
jgi:transposase/DNA-binding CsgD family transcriptional regulator